MMMPGVCQLPLVISTAPSLQACRVGLQIDSRVPSRTARLQADGITPLSITLQTSLTALVTEAAVACRCCVDLRSGGVCCG